jgi:hypothetical protein
VISRATPAFWRAYDNLNASERGSAHRAIREGLLKIANQDSDVALCNETALDGALILDR